jgi:hypothetical protein
LQIVAGIFLLAVRAIVFLALSCLDWLSPRISQLSFAGIYIALAKYPPFGRGHDRWQPAALREIVNCAFADLEVARHE